LTLFITRRLCLPPFAAALHIITQHVWAPLIKLEADHDRAAKEAQRRDDMVVRWDTGLNRRRLAYFAFPQVCTAVERWGGGRQAGRSDKGVSEQ
jgi:hypothetical protein